ncbi:MAG: peptide chain release factor N(5)-glutamine methyltransferase [Actinobacteria bacterium]|nr:MAG: peptide chain release factor N(5)-glutamine methyltransferase [Actinomycetota bacterium]
MTSRELLSSAAEELAAAGCPSPRVDAEWLLAHAAGITRTALYANGNGLLSAEDEVRFRELVARRARREPLAYVLGEWGFRRLMLRVDPRVLVPRPETEMVVERCLTLLADVAEPRVLDIGVGSGAIALAIADEHPRARVVATDSSRGALEVAEVNRARTDLADRVELVEGELFAGLESLFDLVVSNPPYVQSDELDLLEPEVARYEPREALVASGATEAIAQGARSRLRPGGSLVLETGDGKAREIAALLKDLRYEDVAISEDLAGGERIVDGRTPG